MATNTPSDQPHATDERAKINPDVEMVEHYDVKVDNSNAGPEIDRKIERRSAESSFTWSSARADANPGSCERLISEYYRQRL